MAKIPRKVRAKANALAARVGPSYNQAGVTKAIVARERATLRDMYLEGWRDAIDACVKARDGEIEEDDYERAVDQGAPTIAEEGD